MKTARGTLEEALKASVDQNTPPPQPLNQALMQAVPNVPAVMQQAQQPQDGGWRDATATFYRGDEKGDKFGDTTARPNVYGVNKAIEGQTVAVDPTLIPYGSTIEVMDKNGVVHRLVAHDTGSDVVKRTASKARGNDFPVLDIFTKGNANALNSQFGDTVKYRILPSTTLASQ